MKSENYGPQAGEGSAFVFEGVILVLAALVGATITVVGGLFIWAFRDGTKKSPFLPTTSGLQNAMERCGGDGFKALSLSVLERAMGRELEDVALDKISDVPAMTESEARVQLEALGYHADAGFKARWEKLAEGKVAKEAAAKSPCAAPAHKGPSMGEILGLAKGIIGEFRGLIPQPAPASPSAADQAKAIEQAVSAALAKRAQAAKPAAKPRIALNAKQRAAVRAKAVKAVKAVKAATPPAVPAGKP